MAAQDIEALEQEAASNPDSVEVVTSLAAAYAEADRLDEAAEAFEHAATLAPHEVDIQLGLAAVHHARGDDPAVELAVQRAVELDPDDPAVWLTIYEVSDPDENLTDSIVGAARYLEMVDDDDRDSEIAAELPNLLDAAAQRLEAAVATGGVDVEEQDWAAELSAVLPYVRRALPAAELAPYEARIRGARARLLAGESLQDAPATPSAGLLGRESGIDGLTAALDELKAAAELAPLDAELTGLVATLSMLQSEAREQVARAQLTADTRRLFEAVADAERHLAAGETDSAIRGFQEALVQIGELGDDSQPPYQIVAAMAYQGLAHALIEGAEGDPNRDEILEIALEAANEAASRDPEIKARFRTELAAEVESLQSAGPPAELTVEPAASPVQQMELPVEDGGEEPVVEEPEPAMDDATHEKVEELMAADTPSEPQAQPVAEPAEVIEPEPAAVDEQVADEAPEPEPAAVDEQVADEASEPEPAAVDEQVANEAPEPEPAAENILDEVPEFGEPESREDTPLDLSLEAEAKPDVEAEATEEALEAIDELAPLFGIAQEAFDAGNYDRALAAFARATQVADDREMRALAYAGVGATHHAAGRAGEAVAAIDQAVSLDQTCVEAHLVRGELAADESDWRAALQAYQFAEAASRDDARVHKGLGSVLCELEEWDEALESLQKAYAEMQDDPLVIFHMGEVFLATGKKDHALACFEDALEHGLQPPRADEVRAFIQAQKDAPPPAPKPQRAAAPVPDEFDPDTASPDVKRPKQDENLELRERVIRRAVGNLEFDPAVHKKCRLCQAVNDKAADICVKCGQSFSFTEQRNEGGGRPCFIATAACGDEMAPEVRILRAYRDGRLETRPTGRAFTALYYRLSPPAARFIERRPGLRDRVRRWLIRPLARAAARTMATELEER